MKRWRDLLLIVGLFGVLIAFTIYGPGRNESDDGTPGSTYGAGDDGALGLQRWLDALGYNAVRFEYTAWQIPDDADALLMLAPRAEPITRDEADETLRWVRDGGTLILAVTQPPFPAANNALLTALGAEVVPAEDDAMVDRADAAQPLLTTPPVTSVAVNTDAVLDLQRDDYLPLLQSDIGDHLVGVQEGRGYVYLATTLHPFTNLGVREAGSAPLILNLLARVPQGGTVLFDEYHHGYVDQPSAPGAALSQWWGWAILYALLVIVLYIILTGRRFGRPVPLRADVARRSSAEYVNSLALLFRRAGKQDYVRQHYHTQFKRRLARPYGFVPPDDDAAFVRELQRYNGANDDQAARLADLLAQLRSTTREDQLVQTVAAADAFADDRGRIQ